MSKRAYHWRAYLAVGAILIVVHSLIPATAPMLLKDLLFAVVLVSSGMALLVGARLHGPSARSPWLFLAGGQMLCASAGGALNLIRTISEREIPPSWDDLINLASYLMLAAGLALLVRRRTPGWDVPGAIDSAIIAVVAALLLSVYTDSTEAVGATDGLLAEWMPIAFPALDLLLLTLGVRLLLGSGVRTPAHGMLYGSLLCLLMADVTINIPGAVDSDAMWTAVDALFLASALLLGACALHPSMRQLSEPTLAAAPNTSLGRMAVLTVAATTAPTVLLVEYLRGAQPPVLVGALACMVLFPLTLARVSSLVVIQRRMAVTDPLTGLRTRRYFDEQLVRHVASTSRHGKRLGLLLIDVDRFKSINDEYGHDGGDRVLRGVADRLVRAVRSGDVVARYGGEEFVALLPGLDIGEVEVLAERVRSTLADTPIEVEEGKLVAVTISVGAVVLPDHVTTGAELVTASDRAMYAAKNAGRNRVVVAPTPARASA